MARCELQKSKKKNKCVLPGGHPGPHRGVKDLAAKSVASDDLTREELLELLVRVATVIDEGMDHPDLDSAEVVLKDIEVALDDIEDKGAWLRKKWGE